MTEEPDEFMVKFLDEFSKTETKLLAIEAIKILLKNSTGAKAMAMLAIMTGIAIRTLVSKEDFEAAVKIFTIAVEQAPENMPDLRLPPEERRQKHEEHETNSVTQKPH